MCQRKQYLGYQDVLLVPRLSSLSSRDLADVSVDFLGRKFKLPVVPSNMLSVIDENIARFLSENGYFYIYHRYGTPENKAMNTEAFLKWANELNFKLISISIGVKDEDLVILNNKDLMIDFITIDIAHAHHRLVHDTIKKVKKARPTTPLIVGNVATSEAVLDLIAWGADAIKVGVGQGSICTTRFETGFSIPMFSCVQDCYDTSYVRDGLARIVKVIPLIADGGVQTRGDIAKALVAGATMVMCGRLFASCFDSPAPMEGGQKVYFGSTSYEATKSERHIEGTAIRVGLEDSYENQLRKIEESLSSAVSYSGGTDLSTFRDSPWISVK